MQDALMRGPVQGRSFCGRSRARPLDAGGAACDGADSQPPGD